MLAGRLRLRLLLRAPYTVGPMHTFGQKPNTQGDYSRLRTTVGFSPNSVASHRAEHVRGKAGVALPLVLYGAKTPSFSGLDVSSFGSIWQDSGNNP